MMHFGAVLPTIRERVEQSLSSPGMPREKILATILRLMETTFIRVGNEAYARENRSYGLTTLRNKHVAVTGHTVHFEFRGKSGIKHSINLADRRLARIVKQCLDLPGYELFQYVDEEGARHSIDSTDVNDYLREITGDNFTAKDFRTWAGSILVCSTLREFEPFESETQAKKNIVAAIKSTASHLGNTPTVCRKCYVHPTVLEHYLQGHISQVLIDSTNEGEVVLKDNIPAGLREEEKVFLRLLRQLPPCS